MRVVLVAVLSCVARLALADDPITASGESERAKALYAAGDFTAATAAFRSAFELEPRAEYLFGWAQSLRKGGDCQAALVLYDKLLAMTLTDDERAATNQAMSRCDRPPPVVRPPAPIVAPAPDRPSRWYSDTRAHALVALGGVAIGAGLWLTVTSVSDERAAREAMTYGEHERLGDRARIFRVVGIGAIAAGALSAALGVYRYTTHPRRTPAIAAWASGGGGGVAIGGAW
jgi:tetratricopeptide (TPR) repeat protein